MEQTANVDEALALVAKCFKGMTDQDGEPYLMHCLRVMAGAGTPDAQLVGLMHDLIEDTPVEREDLAALGFAPNIVEAVDLLTHKESDSYAEYVIALKPNSLARAAKLSDLRDNGSLGRVLYREESLQRDLLRIQRYILSYQFLTDRIDEVTYRRMMRQLVDSATD